MRFPAIASRTEDTQTSGSHVRHLLHNSNFVLAVAAQFSYVGAQVGVWSFLIRYVQVALPGTPEKSAANFLTLSLIIFMLGRFIGTVLMRYVTPARLLAVFAAINIVLVPIAVLAPGKV